MSISIPRTDNFMALINSRLRFFNGSDVHVGDEFPLGWEECPIQRISDNHSNVPCKVIHYDGEMLYVRHGNIITTLCGDVAGYHGRLLADRMHKQYDIGQFERKVREYMQKHGITEYTSEVGRHALWMKMMPGNIVEDRVRVYEMAKRDDDAEKGGTVDA